MTSLATVTGLGIAIAGPVLIACFGETRFGSPEGLISKICQQIVLVALLSVVLGIVIFWERQPLSSIGLHQFHWRSLLWGLAFAGFLSFLYAPLLMWTIAQLGWAGFATGLAKLTRLPVWYLVLAVVIGGIVEEVLYRGYATERLSLLTGSYWTGCALSLIAFGLAHVPVWGWLPALTTVISGGLLTLLYLATGDLLTAIAAHILTDSIGIIMPAIKHPERLLAGRDSQTHSASQ